MYGFDIIQRNSTNADIEVNGFSCRNHFIKKFENDKLFNENDKYIVILDGVILNKKELESNSAQSEWFETVINLYERNGENFFSIFKGSYAGALYIKDIDKWIIFGDQLGTKYIYYCKIDNFFCCSSMMGSMYNILNDFSIKYHLDEIGVKMLLSYGFMLEDYTLCKEIKKIKPGEYIIYENGRIKECGFYKLNNTKDKTITETDAIETIDMLFRQAVKRQFEKDIEYGYDHVVALSAGLDCRMTSFVAHSLGYTNQTNITFSQSDYYDDFVSKKMATDLGHDWIFKSLDYGNWLLDVDEVNSTTGGNVLYYGTAHGNSIFKRLNFQRFGMLHSGQLGDVVLSVHSMSDNEPYMIGEGAYSQSFIEQLSPFLRDAYPNIEIGLWYCRYLNGTNNGQQNEYNYTETLSPFLDLELLEFALSIPNKIRYNHNIYKEWIIKKYPKAAEYVWTGLGDKITASTLEYKGTKYSRKVFLRKIIQRILGQKSSYYDSKFNMNPVGYYMNQNTRLREMLVNYHQYIDLINNDNIKSEIRGIISSGKSIELIQVHTLMSALKLFFNV